MAFIFVLSVFFAIYMYYFYILSKIYLGVKLGVEMRIKPSKEGCGLRPSSPQLCPHLCYTEGLN